MRKEEERRRAWHYAIVKMTYAEVHLRFDKTEIWSSPESEPLDRWTYFQVKREE
jgi:hypothetical protein